MRNFFKEMMHIHSYYGGLLHNFQVVSEFFSVSENSSSKIVIVVIMINCGPQASAVAHKYHGKSLRSILYN